jgi:hypothetical protein
VGLFTQVLLPTSNRAIGGKEFLNTQASWVCEQSSLLRSRTGPGTVHASLEGCVPVRTRKTEKQSDGLDRREHFRFDVRATAMFRWEDGDGIQHWGEGVTRDISSKGMFVCCNPIDTLPPGKADVKIVVTLSPLRDAGRRLQLEAEAVVIRVEPMVEPKPIRGFAVLNRSHRLKSA